MEAMNTPVKYHHYIEYVIVMSINSELDLYLRLFIGVEHPLINTNGYPGGGGPSFKELFYFNSSIHTDSTLYVRWTRSLCHSVTSEKKTMMMAALWICTCVLAFLVYLSICGHECVSLCVCVYVFTDAKVVHHQEHFTHPASSLFVVRVGESVAHRPLHRWPRTATHRCCNKAFPSYKLWFKALFLYTIHTFRINKTCLEDNVAVRDVGLYNVYKNEGVI